jgi:RecA/RadA recombinase
MLPQPHTTLNITFLDLSTVTVDVLRKKDAEEMVEKLMSDGYLLLPTVGMVQNVALKNNVKAINITVVVADVTTVAPPVVVIAPPTPPYGGQ